jgi:hypothetical protein
MDIIMIRGRLHFFFVRALSASSGISGRGAQVLRDSFSRREPEIAIDDVVPNPGLD